MSDVPTVSSKIEDDTLMKSCTIVHLVEDCGNILEGEFVSKIKLLSTEKGKEFVLILTKEFVESHIKPTSTPKAKGKSAKSKTLKADDEPINHFQQLAVIKKTILAHLKNLLKSQHEAEKKGKALLKKKQKESGKNIKHVPKILLENIEDDRPQNSAELFVVLTGFTDPQLVFAMEKESLPLRAIIKIQNEQLLQEEKNNPQKQFWKTISFHVKLFSTQFFIYPINISKIQANSDFNCAYDVLCCALYEVQDVVQKYSLYTKFCHIYPLDYVKIEDISIYNRRISEISPECITESFVLHCIIEQVVHLEEQNRAFIADFFSDSSCDTKVVKCSAKSSMNDINDEAHLPFILRIAPERKNVPRIYYFNDTLARNSFHMDSFPVFYISSNRMFKNYIKFLKDQYDTNNEGKPHHEFQLNLVLSQVKEILPCVTMKQLKFYIELLVFIIQPRTKVDDNREMLTRKSSLIKPTATSPSSLKKKYFGYENNRLFENGCFSESKENVQTENNDSVDETENKMASFIPNSAWQFYKTHRVNCLHELERIFSIESFNQCIKKDFCKEIFNFHVEYLDENVMCQVLFQEMKAYQKYETLYFAPTDSILVRLYSERHTDDHWSSKSCVPHLLNIQSFYSDSSQFIWDSLNQRKNENLTGIESDLTFDAQDDIHPLFSFDIEEPEAHIKETETIFHEQDFTLKIKKSKITSKHSISINIILNGNFINIYGINDQSIIISQQTLYEDSEEDNFKYDPKLSVVLNNDTVITISKETENEPNTESTNALLSLTSDTKEERDNIKINNDKDEPKQNTLNFTICFPNGLLIDSVQINGELIIRQTYTNAVNKEEPSCYFFPNGKVIYNEGEQYIVYHGNGEVARCKGVLMVKKKTTQKQESSENKKSNIKVSNKEIKENVKSKKNTKRSRDTYKQSLEKITSPDIEMFFEYWEHTDCFGIFRHYENGDLVHKYEKTDYSYAFNSITNQLYISDANETEMFLSDDEIKNISITKFADSLTIISEVEERSEAELYTDNFEQSCTSWKTFNHFSLENILEEYQRSTTDDNFVIIDQTWTIEHENYSSVKFSPQQKVEIFDEIIHISYQNNVLTIKTEEIDIMANTTDVKLKSNTGTTQENKMTYHWIPSIDDSIIETEHFLGSIITVKRNGFCDVTETSRNANNGEVSKTEAWLALKQNGSGYRFIDEKEINKHANLPNLERAVNYNLPNCKKLWQTNFQRQVPSKLEQFLHKPTQINPNRLTKANLIRLRNTTNKSRWFFHPHSFVRDAAEEKIMHSREHSNISKICAIEVRKFEQITPEDTQIVDVLFVLKNLLLTAIENNCLKYKTCM